MKPLKKFDSKELSIMEFREKLFTEEIEKFRNSVTGERTSILPYVRDENGVYSEEKTWKFIRELLECGCVYWEYKKEQWRKEYERGGMNAGAIEELAGASDGLSGQAEEFLSCFLYCALRISEANPWRNVQGMSQTFEDLIRFSREHYDRDGKLYAAAAEAEARNHNYRNMKGIYGPASWLMYLFTGRHVSDLYGEQEKKDYFGYLDLDLRRELEERECEPTELPDSIREQFGDIAEASDGADFDDDGEDFLAGMSETERKNTLARLKREEEKRKKAEDEKERIKAEFAEKQQFTDRYITFLNYRYAPEYEGPFLLSLEEVPLMDIVLGLDDFVKGMIRVFTESRGLSGLGDDDTYFTAMTLLQQSGRRFKKLVQKSREEQ